MKTIKELADELGVSKDKVKYQVKKLPSGTITINTDGIRVISESLGKITQVLPTLYLPIILNLLATWKHKLSNNKSKLNNCKNF